MKLARVLGGLATLCAATQAGATPLAAPPEAPASRYGRLSQAECEAELGKRGVPFKREGETRGVLAPVRLTGPLRGVTFHSALPPERRVKEPWDIVDCRLALALDDFAQILARHDVVDVVHFSAYRPPVVRRGAPGQDPAAAAPPSRQHGGALAMDAAVFVKKDGTKLAVEKDFHGRIGAPTCGAGAAPWPATPEAAALRAIVCEAADQRLFNVLLTPDYNWAHRNHFHLEVAVGASYFLVK